MKWAIIKQNFYIIITPQIFEILENTAPGKGNEIQLTDALRTLISQEAMYAYNFEGRRYDVGDKLGFLQATIEYALKKPELREGFIDYLNTKPWESKQNIGYKKYKHNIKDFFNYTVLIFYFCKDKKYPRYVQKVIAIKLIK